MKPSKWIPNYPKAFTPCPCGCWPKPDKVWVGGYNGMAVIVGCEKTVNAWIEERERKS